MSSNRRLLVLAGVVALVAVVLFIWLRTGSDSVAQQPGTDAAAESPKTPTPRRATADDSAAAQAGNQPTRITRDADPVGSLRLEGQVLDADDVPVAGAIVYLNSRPAQTTVSGDDGSFAFDKLVGRRYVLSAREGNLVGGPVISELSADSDPVVIRLAAGATVSVTVVSRDDGLPIAGARVSLVQMRDVVVTSDGGGQAELQGAPAGWTMLLVRADGYGTAHKALRIPDVVDASIRERVELAPGSSLAGTVIDPDGKAVAGARVVARAASQPFAPIDVFSDGVVTDDKGGFEVGGLAFGTYQLVAFHDDYAAGNSDHVALSAASRPLVTIQLREGAVVAGRVITGDGQPAAWAEVNLVSDPGSRGNWGGGTQRQVVAGEDGSFRIRGLSRSKLRIYAASAEATSEIRGVDLVSRRVVDNLELALTVNGSIAGVVVDEAGEPVAEAQVFAGLDFWSGPDQDQLGVRGPVFATTDGGGRFVLRGLADGDYLVRASRTQISAQRALAKPTKAVPGMTDLRIVLPRDGGIKGRVQTPDGKAPELAMVSISGAGATPVDDGAFELNGLPPGTYDVTVHGATFPRRTVKAVVVEAGATNDIGAVVVQPGRTVGGRVVDAGGRPVAGAQVMLARQLIGDAANMFTQLDQQTELALGVRRTRSGADGRFQLLGVTDDEVAVAAEHPEKGRSLAVSIAQGPIDATADLTLLPLGAVRGRVTLNGEPTADVSVLVASPQTSKYVMATRSGMDGSYLVEGVPAGSYKVSAMLGGGVAGAQMVAKEVTVEPGETIEVDLSIDQGEIDLSILVRGKAGAQVDSAQVFLFGNPEATATKATEINQLFLAESKAGEAKMAFANGGAAAVFAGTDPGAKSLCVIPITGDMNDPSFAQRLQQNVAILAVYCQPITVAPSPKAQTQTVEVPAMTPLPE